MSWRNEAVLYLCNMLVRLGALQFGMFKLTSGKISPYYIDLRIVPSFPSVFKRICDLYVKLLEEEVGLDSFDRIAGIPTAGIPFASIAAFLLDKPLLYVRKEERVHGRERRIEGVVKPGDKVVVLDDLITTGKSILSAVRVLRGEGVVVEDAVVLIDRMEGGSEKLGEDGVKLHSVASILDIAETLSHSGVITDEQYKAIVRQVKGTIRS
ncbi:MAG: orotate phosphoribosyltransferase [Nitrososphaerota archaeon]|nr:orotate phosphoribosyltransferase [Candidatus Bathyarchaeota archaeon]MCX8162188.1 orotate phosphoribosyltransferase [Candidatus Bathyarchaeota archaeon]MDW8062206.1 orotate phosphoribosyltransferase [Nitrososphaerota archaeon]